MPRGERRMASKRVSSSFCFRDLPRPMRIDIDRQGLGDADRIGKLDRAAIGKPGGNDVFRQIARGISGRAIDFCRVLARERTAAMRRRPAIGIDNDLPAGQAANRRRGRQSRTCRLD